MRIQKIFIDGFGIFHHFELGDFSPRLTLILGNNEAGKTTCLAFIRALLFGFPDRRSQENSYPPLAGGRYGGRLLISTPDNQPYVIERRPGPRGGRVTITCPDQSRAGPEVLQEILGLNSKELFRNVFAFSLEELQTFATLNNDSLRETLYSAGAGIKPAALSQLKSRLLRREAELFKPGGNKPRINQLLSHLEEIQREIKIHSERLERYDALRQQIEDLSHQLQKEQEERGQYQGRLNSIKRLIDIWPDWLRLNSAKEELALLEPITQFPEEGVSRLDQWETQIQDLRSEINRLTEELENDLQEWRDSKTEEAALDFLRDFQEIDGDWRYYESLTRELTKKRGERERIRQDLEEDLRRLGLEGKLSGVEAYFDLLEERETVKQFLSRFEERRDTLKEVMAAWNEQRDLLQQKSSEEQEALHHLKSLPRPPEPLPPDTLKQLENNLTHYLFLQQQLASEETRVREVRAQLLRELREIDPSWDIQRLVRVDLPPTVQEEIRRFRDSLSQTEEQLFRQQERVERAKGKYLHALQIRRSWEEKLKDLVEPQEKDRASLTQKKEACRELIHLLSRKDYLERQLDNFREQQTEIHDQKDLLEKQPNLHPLISLRFLKFLFSSIGSTFILSHYLYPIPWDLEIGALLLILAILLMGLDLSLRRGLREKIDTLLDKDRALEQKRENLRKELDQLRGRIDECLASLGEQGPLTREEVEKREAKIEQDLSLLDHWLNLQHQLERAREEEERAEGEWQGELSSLQQGEEELNRWRTAWDDYLVQIGFKRGSSPDMILEIVGRIGLCREKEKMLRDLEAQVNQLSEKARQYRVNMEQILRERGSLPDQGLDILDTVRELLAKNQEETQMYNRWKRAEELYYDSVNQRKGLERRVDQIYQRVKGAERDLQTLQEEWRVWLTAKGLSPDLSPESTLEVLHGIELCRERLSQLERVDRQIQQWEKERDDYQNRVRELMRKYHLSQIKSQDIAGMIAELRMMARQVEEGRVKKQTLESKIQQKRSTITHYQERLKELQMHLQQLLIGVGAHNTQEFRRKAQVYLRRRHLKGVIEDLESDLRRRLGTAELEELRRQDLNHLETQKEELERRIDRLTQRIEEHLREQAVLEEQARHLVRDEQLSSLHLKREALLEELELAAQEWTTLILVRKLINQASLFYERERQPAVLREASRFFQLLTGGSYISIVSPLDQDNIEVIARDKSRKSIDQLSRGTAEQLYLSLRFGFIREYGRRAKPLPIIMDDILVNFDPFRTRAAAQAIISLAQQYQVIYFTCHPEMVALFQEIDPTVKILYLNPSKGHG